MSDPHTKPKRGRPPAYGDRPTSQRHIVLPDDAWAIIDKYAAQRGPGSTVAQRLRLAVRHDAAELENALQNNP